MRTWPWLLLSPLLPSVAQGGDIPSDIPLLHTITTATVVEGSIYFRPGELLVGHPDLAGRPAIPLTMTGPSYCRPICPATRS